MPKMKTADGVNLYYEEAGAGTPVIFVHEFAGDYRTWEPQMRRFSRSHRCITYSQRGYPPLDIPADPARYGQDIARADVVAIMDALDIAKAHIVGHSMGAYTALHVGIRHPERCISVTAAGCGWGSLPDPAARAAMRAQAAETSKMFIEKGIAAAAAIYADTPTRQSQIQGSARFADRGDAAKQAPDIVGHGGRSEDILGAASDYRWRRGRNLPRRQPLSQTHRADCRIARHSALGPHHHQ
jgi:pimeloyl-ACP methyl ester carboxylesterase